MKTQTIENDQKDEQSVISSLILSSFDKSKTRRSHWESLWNECYEYALPQRINLAGASVLVNKTQIIFMMQRH